LFTSKQTLSQPKGSWLNVHYFSCLRLLSISTVIIVPSTFHTHLYPHVRLNRRTNNKVWKPSKKQCSFGKRGGIGYKSTLVFKSFTGILPYPTRRCIKRGHLAEDMYVEPYLLKLILPRETSELGANELYCYCKTRS